MRKYWKYQINAQNDRNHNIRWGKKDAKEKKMRKLTDVKEIKTRKKRWPEPIFFSLIHYYYWINVGSRGRQALLPALKLETKQEIDIWTRKALR